MRAKQRLQFYCAAGEGEGLWLWLCRSVTTATGNLGGRTLEDSETARRMDTVLHSEHRIQVVPSRPPIATACLADSKMRVRVQRVTRDSHGPLLRARRPAGNFTGAQSFVASPSVLPSPGEPDPPRRTAGNYSSRQAPRGPRAPARAPRPPALRPGDGTGREGGRKGRAGGGRAGPCEVREASLSSRSGTGTRTLARADSLQSDRTRFCK